MTPQQLFEQWVANNPSEQNQPNDPGQQARFANYQQQFLQANNVTSLDQIAPGTAVRQPTSGVTGSNPFVDNPALNTATNDALIAGANAAGAGGNANQVQGSTQTGTFGTVGNTATNQNTGSSGTTTGTTSGTTTGTTANDSTGANTSTGNTTVGSTATGTGFNNVVGSTAGSTANTGTTNTSGATTGTSINDTNLNRTGTDTTSNVGTTIGSNVGTNYGSNVGSTTGNTASSNTGSGTNTANTTGAYTGATTGGQESTGSATTGVVDTLGFGDILRGQTGLAAGDDASRRAFLTDLVNTGGSAFQDQVGQATGRALSGPGMQGVGDGARGRAVGAAVGDVARNNLNSRLAGAAQLAGPTATTNLVGAGNPFLGSTAATSGAGTTYGTTSGTNTGTQVGAFTNQNTGNVAQTGTSVNNTMGGNTNNTTGTTTNNGLNTSTGNETGRSVGGTTGTSTGTGSTSNTGSSTGNSSSMGNTGFANESLQNTISNLLNTFNQSNRGSTAGTQTGETAGSTNQTGFNNVTGSETNAGTTTAGSTAVASGNQPQQQTSSGGGGCYVSSVLSLDGSIGQRSIRRACRFKLYKRRDRFMPVGYSLIGPMIAWFVLARAWRRKLVLPAVKAVLYEELRLSGLNLPRKLAPVLWHGLFQSITVSLGFGASLFGVGCVTRDAKMKELLVRNNLYFSLWPS